MEFEKALTELKKGKLITNTNWNGKGMYVFMMKGYVAGVPANGALAEATGVTEGCTVQILPYLMMRNAKGQFVSWLISNMDVFSDEWQVLE